MIYHIFLVINPMKLSLIIVASLLYLINNTVVPHIGPIQTHVPLTYKVNLQDSPLKRYAPIIKDYQQVLTRMIQFVDILPVSKTFYNGVQWYAKNAFKHQDFVAQIDAFAQLSGLPFDKLFFLNFMYEFSTFKACSSILVKNSDGKVIHGRNMDFQMWQLISRMQVIIEYHKDGQKLFTVDGIVGMAMALTATRHGAYSITEDTRFTRHFQEDLISILKDNSIPSAWLSRKVLEEESTYEGAIARLNKEEISGPIYYIVSGIGKGTVIERAVKEVHAAYQLSDENWFLVQTNYDRDEKEPIWDIRRTPVEHKLKERGNKKFEAKTMFEQVLSQWPTFNIATILSIVTIPEIDYYNTTIWYGQNPKQHAETL